MLEGKDRAVKQMKWGQWAPYTVTWPRGSTVVSDNMVLFDPI